MKQIFSGLTLLFAWAAFSLNGADLVDKDGRLYRNFRIREVSNGRAAILYTLADGSPEIAYLPVSKLPDELQRQYPMSSEKAVSRSRNWQSGRTLREKLNLAAQQLDGDLKRLPAGDHAGRRALAGKLYSQLENMLAGYGETVDLQFVSGDRNGSLVRVVGTGVKSQLRSGQYLFMHQSKFSQKSFRMKVYPAGDVINYGKYGRIAIYGESTAKAAEAAGNYIAGRVGDNTLFLPQTPAEDPTRRNTETVSNNVVNNIYYVEDDSGSERVYYKNSRNRRPDKHHGKKPDKNPDKKPDKKPDPNWKPADELPVKQPTVVKKGNEISNYGLLPEWARPGKTGK